jgi:predicted DNA-binding protein YlxM (UPF0122 family)
MPVTRKKLKDNLKRCYTTAEEYRRLLKVIYRARRAPLANGALGTKALNSILDTGFNIYSKKSDIRPIWFVEFPILFQELYAEGTQGSSLGKALDFLEHLLTLHNNINRSLPKNAGYNFMATIYRYAFSNRLPGSGVLRSEVLKLLEYDHKEFYERMIAKKEEFEALEPYKSLSPKEIHDTNTRSRTIIDRIQRRTEEGPSFFSAIEKNTA